MVSWVVEGRTQGGSSLGERKISRGARGMKAVLHTLLSLQTNSTCLQWAC